MTTWDKATQEEILADILAAADSAKYIREPVVVIPANLARYIDPDTLAAEVAAGRVRVQD